MLTLLNADVTFLKNQKKNIKANGIITLKEFSKNFNNLIIEIHIGKV